MDDGKLNETKSSGVFEVWSRPGGKMVGIVAAEDAETALMWAKMSFEVTDAAYVVPAKKGAI